MKTVVGMIVGFVLSMTMAGALRPANAEVVGELPSLLQTFNFSYSTVGYPFVASPFNERVTYQSSFAPQSAILTIPSFGVLGISGRLNSVRFIPDGLIDYSFTSFYDAYEIPEAEVGWRAYGSLYINGQMSIFAGDTEVGGTDFSFGGISSCAGSTPGSCTESGIVVPDFIDGDLGTFNGSDIPILKVVFDELVITGKINDDRGTIYGGEYRGNWRFTNNIIVEYDYTPLSEVPLPPALLLFFSALVSLGGLYCRRLL